MDGSRCFSMRNWKEFIIHRVCSYNASSLTPDSLPEDKKARKGGKQSSSHLTTFSGENPDEEEPSDESRFGQTKSNTIIVHNHVPADCIYNCGVPDRESNETKYLREATDMIEDWQRLLQRGPSVSHPSCEQSDVAFIQLKR